MSEKKSSSMNELARRLPKISGSFGVAEPFGGPFRCILKQPSPRKGFNLRLRALLVFVLPPQVHREVVRPGRER